MIFALDHDSELGLGAAPANEDAAALPQPLMRTTDDKATTPSGATRLKSDQT